MQNPGIRKTYSRELLPAGGNSAFYIMFIEKLNLLREDSKKFGAVGFSQLLRETIYLCQNIPARRVE
jgi:hypothetical protein